jgi:hypothetical protein
MSGHSDLATVLDELGAAQARVRLLDQRLVEMVACADEAGRLLRSLWPCAVTPGGRCDQTLNLVDQISLIGRQA